MCACRFLSCILVFPVLTATVLAINETPSGPALNKDLSPFHLNMEPTDPHTVERVISEWEPHTAVALAMPLSEVLVNPRELAYYREILKAVLPLLPVRIFIDRQNEDSIPAIIQRLNREGIAPEWTDRIEFINARVTSKWIRDYFPIIARDPSGRPILIDPIYTKNYQDFAFLFSREDRQSERHTLVEPTLRLYASDDYSLEDRFPHELARYLRRSSTQPIRVVRPPLFLEGGDFAYDGRDNLFVSQRTLYDNGGDEDNFRELVRAYFNISNVHYLRELPDETVLHLDYVLKFLNPDTCLVGRPYSSYEDTHFRRRLSRETREVLAYNEAYLRKTFPDMTIVPVPFIPPARDSETEFLDYVREEFLHQLAWKKGFISRDAYLSETNAAQNPDLMVKLQSVILLEAGIMDLEKADALDKALDHFFKRTLDDLRFIYMDQKAYFRSYLNSVYLRTDSGKEMVLLPKFEPLDEEEALWMPKVEAEVEAVYRKVLPEAQLVWIPADVVAEYGGALHCTIQVLPMIKP